jgi:hypothetical protein
MGCADCVCKLLTVDNLMVPKKGLEPPHPCGYMDLNHARLPIPPLRPVWSRADQRWTAATPSVTKASTRVKPPCQEAFTRYPDLSDPLPMSPQPASRPIAESQAKEIRRLSHDLSNALEIVLQTSFLLGTVPLDEDAKKWRSMLDNGVQQAAEINRQLREYIRGNS